MDSVELDARQSSQSAGSVSEQLARFALGLRGGTLPRNVVEKVKLLILDTVGVCVGSATMAPGRGILDQGVAWGGAAGSAGDCTLIGDPRRVPAHIAAFVNGGLGHCQDYDDTHTESIMHPSCVLVPAVLASAERHGRSGSDVVTMLAASNESILRLALPADGAINRRGFQATSSLGAFGSAIAAGMAAGFDADRLVQALGIAGSFASGLMECVPAGASCKQVQPGWGGLCGVMAADLAGSGFTGPRSIFEGSLGYYAAMLHGMELDLGRIFSGLGTEWATLDVRPKLYPCAHNVHGAIECAVALHRSGDIRPNRIRSVLCEPPAGAVAMVCEPWERKIAPESGYEARFSLPYVVAVTLVTGLTGPDAFTDALAQDADVRSVMARTRYRVEPDFRFRDMPGRVSVELDDGTTRTHEVPAVRGNAANPIATEELMAKFERNTRSLGEAGSRRLAAMIMTIEDLPGIRPVLNEMVPALAARLL